MDSEAESEDSTWTQGTVGMVFSSLEHSAPHADAAAEDLVEPQEGDVGKPPFAKVLDNIRTLNKLQVPAPKQVREAYSTIKVEQGCTQALRTYLLARGSSPDGVYGQV